MVDALRPFLSRLLAALLAGLCTWLGLRYGITIDATTQQQLVEAIVGVLVAYMSLYAASHRVLDKAINPADTASSHLALQGKRDVRALKVAEHTAERAAAFGLTPSIEEPPPTSQPAYRVPRYRPPANED